MVLGALAMASTGSLIELVAFLEAVVRVVDFAGAAGAGAELEAARVWVVVVALRGAILSGSCCKFSVLNVQGAT